MKRVLIFIAVIVFAACSKENQKLLSDKDNIYGKWYSDNPSVWIIDISKTDITYTNGAKKSIISIDDTAIWYRLPEPPGFTHILYSLSDNGDTLKMGRLIPAIYKKFRL